MVVPGGAMTSSHPLTGHPNLPMPFVSAQGCLDGQPNMDDNDSLPLPFEDFYVTMGENSLRESFRLLACFKKDMHKVETYLRVANCRRSLDSNCIM